MLRGVDSPMCYARNLMALQPANIILKDEYSPCESSRCLNVRVVDFGCSQRVTPSTKLRGKAGTPLFWAPEVLDNAYGMPAGERERVVYLCRNTWLATQSHTYNALLRLRLRLLWFVSGAHTYSPSHILAAQLTRFQCKFH